MTSLMMLVPFQFLTDTEDSDSRLGKKRKTATVNNIPPMPLKRVINRIKRN